MIYPAFGLGQYAAPYLTTAAKYAGGYIAKDLFKKGYKYYSGSSGSYNRTRSSKSKMPYTRKTLSYRPRRKRTRKQSYAKRRTPANRKFKKRGRPYRKRRKGTSGVARRLLRLEKMANSSLSTYVNRSRIAGQDTIPSAEGNCSYSGIVSNSVTILNINIQAVPYFDPSTPATKITVNLSAPAYRNAIFIKKIKSSINMRNNYRLDVKYTLYSVSPKGDTSTGPITAINDGLADVTGTASPEQDPQFWPTDSKVFTELYKINNKWTGILKPGGELTAYWNTSRSFKYRPAVVAEQADTYQKRYQSQIWILRISGTLVHDNGTVDLTTTGRCGIDYITNTEYTIQYPGGSDLYQIDSAETLATILATAVQTAPEQEQANYGL